LFEFFFSKESMLKTLFNPPMVLEEEQIRTSTHQKEWGKQEEGRMLRAQID